MSPPSDLISIVTAVYNREKTIGRALSSINSQEYQNFENIIVDGASTDRTLDIVKGYSTAKTRIISETDAGLYDAINKGVRLSQGEIIGLLHSDDLYPNSQVLGLIKDAFQDAALDAVFADVEYFKGEQTTKTVRRYRSSMFKPSRIAFGLMPAHTTLFLRKRVFERFGYYKTDYDIAADFEFVARIFSGTGLRYRYIPKVLMKMQTGGVSTNGFCAKVRLNREVIRACKENGISTNWAKISFKYPLKLRELIN